jgi:hypothetical protein
LFIPEQVDQVSPHWSPDPLFPTRLEPRRNGCGSPPDPAFRAHRAAPEAGGRIRHYMCWATLLMALLTLPPRK